MEFIIIVISLIIVSLSDIILRSTYKKYKNTDSQNEKTGKEVAEMILNEYDLNNITVGKVSGELSDHYNNRKQVIKLSSDIYSDSSIASVSVAAHECGHAIQYKEGYLPIKVRNFLVPFVNVGNTLGYIVIIISIFASLTNLLLFGLILVSVALLFQIITLPVEFDASRRAKRILFEMGIVEENERHGVASMLSAAAFTYVAGLISSILQILRLVLIFANNNRD